MKPEDIPQEVWDQVAHIHSQPFHWRGPEEVAQIVARAIMAAEKRGEEREREACAAVADEYVWDDHALAQATGVGRAVHHQSVEIAAAIRNRGKP